MFYFFERSQQFIRCEIREGSGGWEIVVTEPNGHESLEAFPSSDAAHARWKEIEDRLKGDGWFGPYGRD